MRRFIGWLVALLIIGAGLSGIYVAGGGHLPQVMTLPKPAAKPTPPPGPLAISTIRKHPTPGGIITSTQTLSPRGSCATTIVSYPSDGLKLFALMEQPSSPEPPGGYPVVVVAHGHYDPGQWQTAGTQYEEFEDPLCQAGYLVLQPDYRGNGESPGIADGGDIYPDYTYDVLNLVHSLPSLHGLANINRVALLGHSMGGQIVLRALVVDPDIKASVLAAGVVGQASDIVFNWYQDPIPADILAQEQSALTILGGTPTASPQAWHDASSINYVSAITGPVQIDHGTADKTVPIQFSQALDDALTKAHKTHTFTTYPGADHFFTNSQAKLMADLVTFLNQSDK